MRLLGCERHDYAGTREYKSLWFVSLSGPPHLKSSVENFRKEKRGRSRELFHVGPDFWQESKSIHISENPTTNLKRIRRDYQLLDLNFFEIAIPSRMRFHETIVSIGHAIMKETCSNPQLWKTGQFLWSKNQPRGIINKNPRTIEINKCMAKCCLTPHVSCRRSAQHGGNRTATPFGGQLDVHVRTRLTSATVFRGAGPSTTHTSPRSSSSVHGAVCDEGRNEYFPDNTLNLRRSFGTENKGSRGLPLASKKHQTPSSTSIPSQ